MYVFISRCHYTVGCKSVTSSLWNHFVLSRYLRLFCCALQGVYWTGNMPGHIFLSFFLLTNLPKKLLFYLLLRYCPQNVFLGFNDTFESSCKGLVVPDKITFLDSMWFKTPKPEIINSPFCLMLACCVPDITILTAWTQWKTKQGVKRCIQCFTVSSLLTESFKTFLVVMAKVLGRRTSYRGSHRNVQKMPWRLIPTMASKDPRGLALSYLFPRRDPAEDVTLVDSGCIDFFLNSQANSQMEH